MSIRQSFICYLALPPARQSATSGVNIRNTLGKSLLREEVHKDYIESGYVGRSGVTAFPFENEIMTACMQWKDQIAYRCPLGLMPPGEMNCVCVCVCILVFSELKNIELLYHLLLTYAHLLNDAE